MSAVEKVVSVSKFSFESTIEASGPDILPLLLHFIWVSHPSLELQKSNIHVLFSICQHPYSRELSKESASHGSDVQNSKFLHSFYPCRLVLEGKSSELTSIFGLQSTNFLPTNVHHQFHNASHSMHPRASRHGIWLLGSSV